MCYALCFFIYTNYINYFTHFNHFNYLTMRTPNGTYALCIMHYALIAALASITSCSSKMQSLDNYNIDETFADMSTKNLHTKYYSQHR